MQIRSITVNQKLHVNNYHQLFLIQPSVCFVELRNGFSALSCFFPLFCKPVFLTPPLLPQLHETPLTPGSSTILGTYPLLNLHSISRPSSYFLELHVIYILNETSTWWTTHWPHQLVHRKHTRFFVDYWMKNELENSGVSEWVKKLDLASFKKKKNSKNEEFKITFLEKEFQHCNFKIYQRQNWQVS